MAGWLTFTINLSRQSVHYFGGVSTTFFKLMTFFVVIQHMSHTSITNITIFTFS